MKKLKNIRTYDARIDFDKDGVDDVAIGGVDNSMFRIERMDNDCFWVCFYPEYSKDTLFLC